MRYGTVCSGIEAPSVAWHPMGWEPVFFSEIEKFPKAVLAHHCPSVPDVGDMTNLEAFNGFTDLDVLIGGTPCQSFSIAGLRDGMADPRGNLALTYLAIADRLRPRWLVWENVPGVLSSSEGRDFGSFLGALGKLGYGWAYRVLDAQYIRVDGFARAVPQRRRRVFVVGCLGGWTSAAAVLFERESLSGNPAPSRAAGQGVAAPVAPSITSSGPPFSRTGNDRVEAEAMVVCGVPEIPHCLNAGGMGRQDFETETLIHFDTTQITRAAGQGRPCIAFLPRQDPISGEVSMPCETKGPMAVAVGVGGSDVGYALRANPSASGDKGDGVVNTSMAVEGAAVRRLTPVECERLQGFPDNYTRISWRGRDSEDCPDGPRYKAIGNSMAVPVIRWIGKRIEAVDGIVNDEGGEHGSQGTNGEG